VAGDFSKRRRTGNSGVIPGRPSRCNRIVMKAAHSVPLSHGNVPRREGEASPRFGSQKTYQWQCVTVARDGRDAGKKPMVQTSPTESLLRAPLEIAPPEVARLDTAPPTKCVPAIDSSPTLPIIVVRHTTPRSTPNPSTPLAIFVSLLVHVAAGIALARAVGVIPPSIEISELGRNSIALIASMEVEAPINPSEQLIVTAALKSEQQMTLRESAAAIEAIAEPPAELLAGPRRIELVQADKAAEETKVADRESSQEGDDRGEKPPTPSQASPGSVASRGADVDRLPAAVFNPAPIYPPDAVRNRWSGHVRLRVRVAADGRVLSASIENSSGFRQLDDSALAAVRQWRFTPAQRNGVAVEWEIGVPVDFLQGSR